MPFKIPWCTKGISMGWQLWHMAFRRLTPFWRRLLEYFRASWELLNATYGQMNQAFSNLIWALSATILIDCCKDPESFGSWATQLPNSLFYKHQFKYERENSINWGTPPLLLIIWLNEATLWKGLPWLVFPEKKLPMNEEGKMHSKGRNF